MMDTKKSENNPSSMYMLSIGIILAAIILSGAIWMSIGSLSTTISAKSFSVSVIGSLAPAAAPVAAAPAPAAAAAPSAALAAAPAGGCGSPQALPSTVQVKIDASGRPVRGDANAKVTMIEFSDFECPFSQAAEPTVQQVMKDYAGKVKLVYMNFPLSFHPNAQKAAEAAECANAQGKFWEYHDSLFTTKQLDVPSLKSQAATVGLDTAKFNTCLDGGAMASIVSSEANTGSQNGVSGTPTFFVNGKALVGAQPYAQFKTAIDAALAG